MAERFHQGDLIKMNFDPTKGHEQRGYRPALVISGNDFNELCGGMVKVLAITSEIKKFPLNMELPAGLPIHGQVLLSQERSVDTLSRDRSCKKVGRVPDGFMQKVLDRVALTYK